jgi:hypothetical protein
MRAFERARLESRIKAAIAATSSRRYGISFRKSWRFSKRRGRESDGGANDAGIALRGLRRIAPAGTVPKVGRRFHARYREADACNR